MIDVQLLDNTTANDLASIAIESAINDDRYKVGPWADFDLQEMTDFFQGKVTNNLIGTSKDKDFRRSYVILKDDKPIGEFFLMNYDWYLDCPLTNEYKISSWLAAPYRNQGIASCAFDKLIPFAKAEDINSIGAATVIGNNPVIHLLKKMNWEDLGDFWMPSVSERKGWHHFYGFRKTL